MTLTKFKLYNFQTDKNRRISVISNTGKILERPMYYRIYKFFNDKKLIYPLQFGFRQKHKKNLDKENSVFGIFTNFQKSFDAVEHNTLFSKLEHYCVRGLAKMV